MAASRHGQEQDTKFESHQGGWAIGCRSSLEGAVEAEALCCEERSGNGLRAGGLKIAGLAKLIVRFENVELIAPGKFSQEPPVLGRNPIACPLIDGPLRQLRPPQSSIRLNLSGTAAIVYDLFYGFDLSHAAT